MVWALLVTLLAAPSDADVRRAVGRGVAWLRKEQRPDGSFGSQPGETGLALLALRHSGVPASDDVCRRATRALLRELPDGQTYSAALGVMALLAQSPERHKKKIRSLVRRLEKGQCKNGQWTYRLRTTGRRSRGDNSNTQLAILALASARARNVPVSRSVFERLRAYLHTAQNEDGGFGYGDGNRHSYSSMTSGGIMALAICDAELGSDPSENPRIARALAWLARDFDPTRNRGAGRARSTSRQKRHDNFWRHYGLWSLERAAAVLKTDRIGTHDWYGLGAAWLLRTQQPEGCWRNPEKKRYATCFALLFLTRGTRSALTPRERDRPVTSSGPPTSRE